MIKFSKYFFVILIINPFIGCSNSGDKFIGNYTLDKNSDKPVFSIIHNIDNIYIAKPLFSSSREYIFKYNSSSKILISADNDSISLEKNELKFTNENGSKFFYKLK